MTPTDAERLEEVMADSAHYQRFKGRPCGVPLCSVCEGFAIARRQMERADHLEANHLDNLELIKERDEAYKRAEKAEAELRGCLASNEAGVERLTKERDEAYKRAEKAEAAVSANWTLVKVMEKERDAAVANLARVAASENDALKQRDAARAEADARWQRELALAKIVEKTQAALARFREAVEMHAQKRHGLSANGMTDFKEVAALAGAESDSPVENDSRLRGGSPGELPAKPTSGNCHHATCEECQRVGVKCECSQPPAPLPAKPEPRHEWGCGCRFEVYTDGSVRCSEHRVVIHQMDRSGVLICPSCPSKGA